MKLNDVSKELVVMAAHVKAADCLPDDSTSSMVDEIKKIALILKEVEAMSTTK